MLQFGARSLLVATVMFAIAVPAFLTPGGMYFYLPLLFVFFLSVTFAALLLKWLKTPSRGPIAKQIPLLLVAVSLLLSIVAFAMLFDVAIDRFETVRFNTTQRQAALTIADPGSFRDACLTLHSQMIASSGIGKVLDGTAHDLPPEIRAINPIKITASDHYINIQVTRDGGSLVAYPLDGTFAHVRSRKLAECLYYWPN